MLTSMTGFSRVSLDREWGRLTLEVSSVNSRYLEVSFKSARELLSQEFMVQSFFKKHFNRGKILVRADLSWNSSKVMGSINREILLSYKSQLDSIGRSEGFEGAFHLDSLLSLPGVIEGPETSLDTENSLAKTLEEALDQGALGLKSMRETEGRSLYDDIIHHLNDLEKTLKAIDSKWPACAELAFQSLKEKVQAVSEKYSCPLDQGRLAQELAIIGDKWDISEEISRTFAHMAQFKTHMDCQGPKGRKLDFLIQEMNRELNTMGSKVQDCSIRWLVVDGKTILERIREQVQNAE